CPTVVDARHRRWRVWSLTPCVCARAAAVRPRSACARAAADVGARPILLGARYCWAPDIAWRPMFAPQPMLLRPMLAHGERCARPLCCAATLRESALLRGQRCACPLLPRGRRCARPQDAPRTPRVVTLHGYSRCGAT